MSSALTQERTLIAESAVPTKADRAPTIQPSLRSRAIRGSLWTLGGYGGAQILRLGTNVILARMLVPEAFGLMALVAVFMQGLQMFSDLGIGPSIIQHKRGDDPAFLNTAWTIQIFRGAILWITACALAWPITILYSQNDPIAHSLLYILPVASLTALFAGFNSPALAILNRHLSLHRLITRELGSKVVFLLVAVLWARFHPTVWALVAGGLASALYLMITSHTLMPAMRPRLAWDRDAARDLMHFGKWIFLSTAFTFLAANLDKVVLGVIMPMQELGLYGIAFGFAAAALQIVSRLTQQVLFPALSRLQHDPDRLLGRALEARRIMLIIGGTLCVAIALNARWFFTAVYPPDFWQAGPYAQLMSLYLWCTIMSQTLGQIQLALGQSRALFVKKLLETSGIIAAVGAYHIGGANAFIAALAVGPLIGLMYVILWLPAQKRAALVQSIATTVFMSAVLLFGLAMGIVASDSFGHYGDAAVSTALTAMIALASVLHIKRSRLVRASS